MYLCFAQWLCWELWQWVSCYDKTLVQVRCFLFVLVLLSAYIYLLLASLWLVHSWMFIRHQHCIPVEHVSCQNGRYTMNRVRKWLRPTVNSPVSVASCWWPNGERVEGEYYFVKIWLTVTIFNLGQVGSAVFSVLLKGIVVFWNVFFWSHYCTYSCLITVVVLKSCCIT